MISNEKNNIFLAITLFFSVGCTDMPGELENSLNGDEEEYNEDVTCISIFDIDEEDVENVDCFSIPDLGMEFVRIPAGTFTMGNFTPELV